MHPDDERRNQREADIAKATRGPDYSRLEAEIAGNKAEHAKKAQAGVEARAHHNKWAAFKKMMEESVWTPQVRENERDDGWER
ncbi:MAG: hypothetical protein AAGK70_16835 [Pseudomonadota bacterium]